MSTSFEKDNNLNFPCKRCGEYHFSGNTDYETYLAEYNAYINSPCWRRFSSLTRRAFPWCSRCMAQVPLQVHHLTYETLGAERPEDIDILCADCHKETKNGRTRQPPTPPTS